MKLHLACGDIYLKDYINCDIEGTKSPSSQPKSLNNYFHDRKIGERKEIYIDQRLDLLKIPYPFKDNSIEEVVMISSIEHFKKEDAITITKEVNRILMPGGKLIIDFPDINKIAKQFLFKDTEWCFRLIYCNNRNEYAIHRWGYTIKSFKELLGSGWKKISKKMIVKHDYPVIGIVAEK